VTTGASWTLLLRLPMTHGADRRRLADELTSELIRHAVAEDLYLYPAVPAFVAACAVDAARETGAHTRIEQLLTDDTDETKETRAAPER
jgi:hypothetical protein